MNTDMVTILMGVYNGADFLAPQLHSFANQTHKQWALVANDDGSHDQSIEILQDFGRKTPQDVRVGPGPQQGFARNFLHLLCAVPPHTAVVALSDQDDIWLPEKIERAVHKINAYPPDEPVLYGSRTWIYTDKIDEETPSKQPRRGLGFRNALIENFAGGNTFVLNRAAVDLLRAASHEALENGGAVASHDWWIYQIISGAGGHVIFDPRPTLHYRQHAGNAIGANRGMSAYLGRFRALYSGRLVGWNSQNIAALQRSAHRLTAENRASLEAFSAARKKGVIARLRALRRSGVYRQGRAEGVIFWLACLFGKI